MRRFIALTGGPMKHCGQMRRAIRILISGSAFFVFFVGAAVISWLMIPLLSLSFDPEVRRRRHQAMARFATRGFTRYMILTNMIETRWPPLPADFPSGAYVMIANHPTLVDVTVVMTRFPELSTVVGRKWFARRGLGGMLKAAGWIPSVPPGSDDEDTGSTLDGMLKALSEGIPMIIFPEGTRSDQDRLRRFRRGAVEAAIRAGVPIVPLFIDINQPMLMRGQPWYDVHEGVGVYTLEFWPVIETAGQDLDARALNQELAARYKARFARMLEGRKALKALKASEPN